LFHEFEAKEAELRHTLSKISGAIQVLEEGLSEDGAMDAAGPEVVSGAIRAGHNSYDAQLNNGMHPTPHQRLSRAD
jgi:hypothetical protein